MREMKFQTVIPGCSTQDFFTIACSDSRAITQFHRDVNKDETVLVSEWSDGQRMVEFTLAMAIPSSVKSFIGGGPIRIKEVQRVTWQGDACLKILSEPELQISYAKALKTAATLLITDTPQGGVSIDVAVQVDATVPWPMQGTVESIMADQARKTVGQYVQYIGGYVEAALEEMNNTRTSGAEEGAAPGAAAEAGVEVGALQQQQQQQQEQQLVVAPLTPVEAPAAAVPARAAAAAVAVARPPVAAAAAAVVPAAVQRPPMPVAAAAAAEAPDVFYDASEAVPGSTLDLLLRELREERAARMEANRLLASIKESMQHLDQTLSRELAFQEGVRYAQRGSGATLLLTVATAAAAASAATAYLLMRRNALK